MQPEAQYGQTVTTFFIGLAPVSISADAHNDLIMQVLCHVFIVGIHGYYGDFLDKTLTKNSLSSVLTCRRGAA
ncbi:hypothetical protein DBY68_018545 [Pseudocitrobacter sp. RIT415]|nr:hypothetical protein DBY68_018545 [Pseudocitrobacter sp. RIT 415]